MENITTNKDKDVRLWHIAQQRATFKKHLSTYLVMTVFFWGVWYFSGGQTHRHSMPWPVWPMLGWGLGVAFHFINAYLIPKSNAVENEYEKLITEQKTKN